MVTITYKQKLMETNYCSLTLSAVFINYLCTSCGQFSYFLGSGVAYDSVTGEELYCSCREPYDARRFMIGCDNCEGWYHARCANITPDQAEKLKTFICPPCRRKKGEKVVIPEFDLSAAAEEELLSYHKQQDYDHFAASFDPNYADKAKPNSNKRARSTADDYKAGLKGIEPGSGGGAVKKAKQKAAAAAVAAALDKSGRSRRVIGNSALIGQGESHSEPKVSKPIIIQMDIISDEDEGRHNHLSNFPSQHCRAAIQF
jgi:hypothetical protein